MDNYILMNDMVQDHEARMMHLKRLLSFFQINGYRIVPVQGRKLRTLDMSYIVLAVLRFLLRRIIFRISRYAMRITGNSWPDFGERF